MSVFRLLIVIGLFVLAAAALWRLQRVKAIRIFTRIVLLPGLVVVVILAAVSTHAITQASQDRLYDDVIRIPTRDIALVLGANKSAAPLLFANRIDAATALFKAGKVREIVVSGASRPDGYDEAADMKKALVANGIPASAIVMDASGQNTLSSISRCNESHPRQLVTIVSQRYHVARGVYIASKLGMDAVGFSIGGIGRITSPRELLSRIKAVFVTRYEIVH